jgi:hypothetical protein
MTERIFRIRKAFLIPLALDVTLLLILFLLSVLFKGMPSERVVLAAFFIPSALIFFEAVSRRVIARDQEIVIKKFLREKSFQWHEITHVGTLMMRKKIYFLLTTTKGFHVLSNAYKDYPDLVRHLDAHLDKEKVDDEVRAQAEKSVANISDIIAAWFAVVVLLGIIMMKIFSF